MDFEHAGGNPGVPGNLCEGENMTEDHAALMDRVWLPNAPLASNSKTGPYRRTTRAKALKKAYIEANPTVLQSLIITDHDGGMADELPGLLGLPAPSWTALNPNTRGGHIVYALGAPVCLTNAAHRRPVNLLARVEAGLTTVLGGDPAFAGRITKNPTCVAVHLPLWGPNEAVYGLKELAAALSGIDALPRYDDHKALRVTGVGRNVDLFNYLRKWAYPRRGSYGATPQGRKDWEDVVHDRATLRNADHIGNEYARGPLSANEVKHLANSVSRWTWRNIAPVDVDEWLRQRQSVRGKKSAAKRWGNSSPSKIEGFING